MILVDLSKMEMSLAMGRDGLSWCESNDDQMSMVMVMGRDDIS